MNQKFLSYSQTDQEWVLDYLLSGKGTIPYEMISRFDSLDKVLEEEFFPLKHFIQGEKET